ncbi:MAG: hypothetical protein ACLRZL_11705 [Alistipes communis]
MLFTPVAATQISRRCGSCAIVAASSCTLLVTTISASAQRTATSSGAVMS